MPWPACFLVLSLGGLLGCPPPPPPPRPVAPPGSPEEKKDEPKKQDEPQEEKAETAPITSERAAALLEEAKKTGVIEAFSHMKVFTREKRIEIDGVTALKVGPQLELLACSPRGKSYESLLIWLCEPTELHLALLFLGLTPAPQIEQFGQQGALAKGDKVVIEVAWKDPKTGQEVRRRAEDLLFDNSRDGAMKHVGWVFTGSRQVEVPQPPHWDTSKQMYAAQVTGTVAVTYHDPDAILDTPLAEGGNNTLFVAWSERLPERHTPVTIHIRPWRDGDDQEPADSKRAPGTQRPPGGGPPGGGPMDDTPPPKEGEK
jgi:hypothetical protein